MTLRITTEIRAPVILALVSRLEFANLVGERAPASRQRGSKLIIHAQIGLLLHARSRRLARLWLPLSRGGGDFFVRQFRHVNEPLLIILSRLRRI